MQESLRSLKIDEFSNKVSWLSIIETSLLTAYFLILILGTRASGLYGSVGYYTPLAYAFSVYYIVPILFTIPLMCNKKSAKFFYNSPLILIASIISALGSVLILSFAYENVLNARIGSTLVLLGYSMMIPSICRTVLMFCNTHTATMIGYSILFAIPIVYVIDILEWITSISATPLIPIIISIIIINKLKNIGFIPYTENKSTTKNIVIGIMFSISLGFSLRGMFDLNIRSMLNATQISLEHTAFFIIFSIVVILIVQFVKKLVILPVLCLLTVIISILINNMDGYEVSFIQTSLFAVFSMSLIYAIIKSLQFILNDSTACQKNLPIMPIYQLGFTVGFILFPTIESVLNIVLSNGYAVEEICLTATIICTIIVIYKIKILHFNNKTDKKKANHNEEHDRRMLRIAVEKWGLTTRETDTLAELVRGRTAQRIADRMCVSINTARSHIKHVYTKMGVHSQQELIDLFEELSRTDRNDSDDL